LEDFFRFEKENLRNLDKIDWNNYYVGWYWKEKEKDKYKE